MASRAAKLAVLALALALVAVPARAFYLPGVAPQDFAPVRARADASRRMVPAWRETSNPPPRARVRPFAPDPPLRARARALPPNCDRMTW
jgi:hypothetical protein